MNSTKSRTYQGLIGMCLGTVVLPARRVPERHVACPALAINVHPEAPCNDLQILHAPVARILPHAGKDLLSIGHDFYGTEYGTTPAKS